MCTRPAWLGSYPQLNPNPKVTSGVKWEEILGIQITKAQMGLHHPVTLHLYAEPGFPVRVSQVEKVSYPLRFPPGHENPSEAA